MKKFTLLITTIIFVGQVALAQRLTITGTVTSKDDKLPVIGASIIEKGTTNGTITNFDGQYSLEVQAGATLVFSYVGMERKEVRVGAESVIHIELKSDAVAIDEVVVTAMGVKQEKKKLNFAVQSLSGEALTENRSANFVNSLQGKVSGVRVSNAGGSPNSGTQIILRGISSINGQQNNEPLFIVDGMPISGGGSSAAIVNPNDIENVTVLKGAAASALYGQEAANGVVMITTKQGRVGKIATNITAGIQIDQPVRLPKIQQVFGPGSLGFYRPLTGGGWGPPLQEDETIYNNIGNFLQNGIYQKYDIRLSGGTDKFQSNASASYTSNEGIVPNDYLKRTGIKLKTQYQATSKLSASLIVDAISSISRGAGGISSVYLWPINDDIMDYQRNSWPRFRYLSETAKEDSPISPMYSRMMDSGQNRSLRNLINGNIEYKALKNLTFTARLGYDESNFSYDGYAVPRFDDSVILPELDPNSPTYATALNAQNKQPFFTEKQLASIDKDLLGNYAYSQSNSRLFSALGMVN